MQLFPCGSTNFVTCQFSTFFVAFRPKVDQYLYNFWVSRVTGHELDKWGVQLPVDAYHQVCAGSGVHPISYPMVTLKSSLQVTCLIMNLITQLQLVLRWKVSLLTD